MAKILKVSPLKIPEVIAVGDDDTDIIVSTTIEFHKLDYKFEMEYLLLLYVYDIKGKLDIPVIVGNWNATEVIGVKQDRKDQFLGSKQVEIKAQKSVLTVETPMSLKLGLLKEGSSYFSRELEVFATLIPAIGRASKWSEPFQSEIVF